MANSKISALTAAALPLAGTEVLPIVQSGATVKVANNDLRPKQIQSNATTGVLQIAGPAAASTRVMTTPDANFTVARTDAGQTFSGDEVFSTSTAFSRGNDSTTGIKVGAIDTGSSTMFRTPSVNGSFSSGLVVDGAYSSGLSTINLRALGVNSGGGYNSKFAFWTTFETSITKVAEIDNNGNYVPQLASKGVNFTANTGAAGMTSQLLNWYEEGTWTPNQGAGLTLVGAFSSAGTYTRLGRQVFIRGSVSGATSVAVASAGAITTNLPYSAAADATGTAINAANNTSSVLRVSSATLTAATAIAATATITFSAVYSV